MMYSCLEVTKLNHCIENVMWMDCRKKMNEEDKKRKSYFIVDNRKLNRQLVAI